jgi:hypothetical protein
MNFDLVSPLIFEGETSCLPFSSVTIADALSSCCFDLQAIDRRSTIANSALCSRARVERQYSSIMSAAHQAKVTKKVPTPDLKARPRCACATSLCRSCSPLMSLVTFLAGCSSDGHELFEERVARRAKQLSVTFCSGLRPPLGFCIHKPERLRSQQRSATFFSSLRCAHRPPHGCCVHEPKRSRSRERSASAKSGVRTRKRPHAVCIHKSELRQSNRTRRQRDPV